MVKKFLSFSSGKILKSLQLEAKKTEPIFDTYYLPILTLSTAPKRFSQSPLNRSLILPRAVEKQRL
jgi:hypothetical protein